MRLNNKGTINSFKTTAKTHAAMDEKIAIPLYAEHLRLLLSRYGWRVTKFRGHYTFEQKKFKMDFVIMNQVSRQKSQIDEEKDFNKLINNANFGYDCRNNADNCFCTQKGTRMFLIKVLLTLFHLEFFKNKLRKNF